jgi:DNA ligase-1
MLYARVVAAYRDVEHATSRKHVRETLVSLLRDAPAEVLPKLVYLTQGKLCPDFEAVEIGLAERLALRAVAAASGRSEREVAADLARSGDLGTSAERLLAGTRREPTLTVEDVHSGLAAIARMSGPGAIGRKVATLEDLLRRASPVEARYLVRTATGRLRLGVTDMTLLDALAIACGGSEAARPAIERAYNLGSDLGAVAATLVRGGLAALQAFTPAPFRPIRPMQAERLTSADEVLAKLGGHCAAEFKYDGERLQIHKRGAQVRIFSRRIEPITDRYPDAAELSRVHLRAKVAIFEAEAVARDAKSGDLLPFQELMRRKRKHGVEEAAAALPISLVAFDLLYVDGEDLTQRPYPERRSRLERELERAPRFQGAERTLVESVPELEDFFDRAVGAGAEGLVCKSIAPNSVYRAGSRTWLWIKLKRDSRSALIESVDLVAVGAFYGRGRRAGTSGSLLLAAYDREADVFRTVTKCGSGYSDEELARLPERLAPHVIPLRHARVDAKLDADVWFVPALVLEVIGAEVTLSPIHTAALGRFRPGSGLAIRYPRFTGRWRDDKAPEDATTVEELVEMYQRAGRATLRSPEQ